MMLVQYSPTSASSAAYALESAGDWARKLRAMGRFREPPDPVFRSINTSVGFDRRLAAHDIAQSKAHVAMLAGSGVLSAEEAEQLTGCLEKVAAEVGDGGFEVRPDDEDIHMAIERRLTELAGPVGGKLHTARSRNDQVATDMAMFVREEAESAQVLLAELLGTLIDQAERHIDWPMPGYTHLQRAQPVYLSHHLLAYFWMFKRDFDRFAFCRDACGELPLGAGALAGVNWNTSRMRVAEELGFEAVAANSLDAVSNRDFVLDYLSAASICAMHLSRLGGEIVLWSSEEFGFLELADSFSSGSSIMPQKKNPDAAELLRAKAPRVAAHLTALLGVLHGLPLAYNKDMQEDKEHLFDAVDTLDICLRAAAGMLSTGTFKRDALAEAAGDEFLAATDVADLLVRRGLPFREAHGVVSSLVRHALEQKKKLSELSAEELSQFSDRLDKEYYEVLAAGSWLDSKVSEGGTSADRVQEQLGRAKKTLKGIGDAKA
jgi:argininosuccinate lyase